MGDLIEKLGINWKLLIAQIINFFIILTVLRFTIYKPLMTMLQKRRQKIEGGLKEAAEAEERMKNIEQERTKRIAEIEKESLDIYHQAEIGAKKKEENIISSAREKETDIIKDAEKVAQYKKIQAEEKVYQEVGQLVRQSIEKIAQKKPGEFDETLINQALSEIKQNEK
jgi:F-type H+-transporting ATPase subunit b